MCTHVCICPCICWLPLTHHHPPHTPHPHPHSNGGRVHEALNYTQEMGIRTLGSYPYEGTQGTCSGPDPAFAYSAGPTFVAPCDERQLMKALYYFGPVAVNVKANCPVRPYVRPSVIDDNDDSRPLAFLLY